MAELLMKATGLSKSYGNQTLFTIPELEIYAGDHIGLVGTNGCGKTTLLSILSGELEADKGKVERWCETAVLRQFGEAEFCETPGVWSTKGSYSGGEQARKKIAGALQKSAPLLLADEPTANLDTDGVRMLGNRLSQLESFVLVSHDRALLDRVCSRILELRDGKLFFYEGNFTGYRKQVEEQRKRRQIEYEQYIRERARLEAVYAEKKRKAAAVIRPSGKMTPREARLNDFLAVHKSTDTRQRSLERAAQSVQKRISRLEVREKPRTDPHASFDFSLTDPPGNRIVLRAEHLRFSYLESSRMILDDVSFEIPTGSRTALHGRNGSGKTTLLRLIAEGGPVPSGTVYTVPKLRIGYFRQGLENLDLSRTALENVMEGAVQSETAARSILGKLLLGNATGKLAGSLSGGERIRLSFAKLFASPANFLLLDEPTNFLDFPSIEALQEMLCEYEGTLLFVSHDRAFADAVSTRSMYLEGGRLESFAGSLPEYERWKKSRREKAVSQERQVLEFRRIQVIGALSAKNVKNKEKLEQQYEEIVEALRKMGT